MSDDRFNRLEQKIDVIATKQSDIFIVLTDQHATLREHMKRSKANEEAVELIRKEIKPIQKHVDMISGGLKFIGILALLGTVLSGIIDLLNYLRH